MLNTIKRLLVLMLFMTWTYPVSATVITVSSGQSIQSAVNMASSGDKIIVSGDHSTERINVTKNNLTIEAAGEVISKGFTISASNVTIRGFTVINLTGAGIEVNSGSNGVIENNQFLYNGEYGLDISNSTNGWIVGENRFHRNNIAGAQIKGNNHLVEGNDVSNTIQYSPCVPPVNGADADGFRFHGGGHVFRNNYIHDMLDGRDGYDKTECSIEALANLENDYDDDSHSDCFQTFGGSSSFPVGHDILFDGNICHLSPSSEQTGGFSQKVWQGEDAYNLTMKNNLIFADFISLFYDCSNVVYDHNTFIGSGSIKYFQCGSGAGRVTNNIFYGSSPYHFELPDSSPNINHNCVYRSGGLPSGTFYTGDIKGSGQIMDSSYHLLPDSLCKGAASDGSDMGANIPYPWTNSSIYTISPTISVKQGDANGDGKVDGVDYIVWLNHYGQNVSGAVNGNFNGNNGVDGVDYIVWLNNYGK